MVTKRSVLVVSVVCALLAPLCARDRKPGSSRIREVELPADYNIDLELALKGRPERMGGSPELVGTSLNQVGDEVFGNLVGNVAITSLRLPYRWKLTLVDADVVNASSTAGGQVYVYRNLATLIGSNRGLWAAVLSHEIAHTALRQQVRIYLQQRHYVAQEMQLLVREQEQQADIQGMFLMALAGYHPDYVFALHHLLQMTVGDESNSAAFFSDHPRWATRDQRGERAYAQALAEYSQLWAEPASSPGGTAPVV